MPKPDAPGSGQIRGVLAAPGRERNHQSLDNQLIVTAAANENGAGPVLCRERLGGMLKFYYRDAA